MQERNGSEMSPATLILFFSWHIYVKLLSLFNRRFCKRWSRNLPLVGSKQTRMWILTHCFTICFVLVNIERNACTWFNGQQGLLLTCYVLLWAEFGCITQAYMSESAYHCHFIPVGKIAELACSFRVYNIGYSLIYPSSFPFSYRFFPCSVYHFFLLCLSSWFVHLGAPHI